jgi:hypothetical protein
LRNQAEVVRLEKPVHTLADSATLFSDSLVTAMALATLQE